MEYEVDGKVVRENKVLFRFKVAISDIINALESSAPFPLRGFSPFVPSVDTSEGGIVDSFYAVVAMHFFYLATDLRYILQLLVIALAPWRFVSLFYYLLEPIENNASSIRSGLLQCINDAGLHLISYRREIAVPMNELTKEISSSASNGNMYNTYALWRAVDSFTNMRLDHQVEEIESVDLQSFIFLYKFMLKLCTVYEDLG